MPRISTTGRHTVHGDVPPTTSPSGAAPSGTHTSSVARKKKTYGVPRDLREVAGVDIPPPVPPTVSTTRGSYGTEPFRTNCENPWQPVTMDRSTTNRHPLSSKSKPSMTTTDNE